METEAVKSAVEWLEEKYKESNGKLTDKDFTHAKQLEIQQLIHSWLEITDRLKRILDGVTENAIEILAEEKDYTENDQFNGK